MKRLTVVLSALSLLFAAVLSSAIAKAQGTAITFSNLPVLDTSASTSANSLKGVEGRETSLDYELLFLPRGTGEGTIAGRRAEKWPGYFQENLNPIAATVKKPVASAVIPPYAIVEPNKSIQTQADPQRLTVSTPTQ
jgi:hypothetical protein